MKYKLIKPVQKNYSTIEQILTNRNIQYSEIQHYLNSTDKDINSPLLLGEDLLKNAATAIIKHIQANDKCAIVCDCDCDGFTSAALMGNYLYELFPAWTETNVSYLFHEGKQHGLNDLIEQINQLEVSLIIVPDAGTNDLDAHKIITAKGIDLIILDHHLIEQKDKNTKAIIINNQDSDMEYPNKELSGVGIVWQFCRYLDSLLKQNKADNFLDLVALGLTGDMMSLTSIETKHLINKGFEPNNIHNPYIYGMWQKNSFKLGDHINSIDAAFYIVPMINAVQRSGTLEEKILLFNSMLKYKAFKMIPSTKRGCKGQEEKLVDQAVRMSTNVKNRQTKAQDVEMETLEKIIKDKDMLKHKALVFILDIEINKNIAGLIANKLAAKYQRPCCILSKTLEIDPEHTTMLQDGTEVFVTSDSRVLYQGSARGYEMSGLTNFKDICEGAGAEWTAGHQNAFGLCVTEDKIGYFINAIDLMLSNLGISTEPIYYVDYIYNGININPQDILTISNLKNLWGKDLNEPYIAIEKLKIEKSMVTVYRKKGNTLKITLPNKVNLMKFNATDEECERLEEFNEAYLELNVVGKCYQNEWMGNISAQIFITDYEITGKGEYLF